MFPSLRAAEEFERAAGGSYRAERHEFNDRGGYSWQVRVVVRMTPTYAGVTRLERELAALADSCGGRADGWGVLA